MAEAPLTRTAADASGRSTRRTAARRPGSPPRSPRSWRPLARAVSPISEPLARRLYGTPPPEDRSPDRVGEGGGRLDRLDLLAVVAILVVTLGTRLFNIDTPRTMYFDELYYPSTGAEFLGAWRYGQPTNIFEWTHPHVSKYLMAASLGVLGNDRVTGTANLGSAVTDVAFEPAIADATAPGGYRGDRIAVATGQGVTILPHGAIDASFGISMPGTTAVAFDDGSDQLYSGAADGTISTIDGSSLDLVSGSNPTPEPLVFIRLARPITHLWVVGPDRILAETDPGSLTLVDPRTAPHPGDGHGARLERCRADRHVDRLADRGRFA